MWVTFWLNSVQFVPNPSCYNTQVCSSHTFSQFSATNPPLYKQRKTEMSDQSGMAWGPTAGGGGELNLTNLTKAGPYRGGLCKFGHRVPGPVPRPIPNSFTCWGGQQTDPLSFVWSGQLWSRMGLSTLVAGAGPGCLLSTIAFVNQS